MLVTLLASVGAAWLLVNRARANARWGADTIARIRQDGLQLHWQHHPPIQWYLIRFRDRVVGWRADVRVVRKDHGYDGVNVLHGPSSQGPIIVERWTLNADATAGKYESARAGMDADKVLVVERPDTYIALSDGRVQVQHAKHGQSQAAEPANYVPEGALELACYVAGRRAGRAQFKAVLNDTPPKNERIDFSEFTVMNTVRSQAEWRITWRRSKPPGPAIEQTFDNEGRLLQSRIGPRVESAASEQEIAKVFSNAADILQQALKPPVSKRPPPGNRRKANQRSFRRGAVGAGYRSTG
jgi:hypothetical protein